MKGFRVHLLRYLLRYLVAVNIVEFSLLGWDKLQAKNKGWRVAETQLLIVALFGGTPAAFVACSIFRHKIRKDSFMNSLRAISVLQVCAIAYYFMNDER